MDGNRAYRQQGYRDTPGDKRDRRDRRDTPRPRDLEGPRTPKMPGSRAVSRCAGCGTLLRALTDAAGQCPTCGLVLHSCKQCAHFDPGRRFECAQPVVERISDKTGRNQCPSFTLRTSVERETSAGTTRPEDARRAFENLFKK